MSLYSENQQTRVVTLECPTGSAAEVAYISDRYPILGWWYRFQNPTWLFFVRRTGYRPCFRVYACVLFLKP